MKNIARYTLITGSLSIVVFLCYAFFIAPWPGDTVSIRTVTSGAVGKYRIGSTREELIQDNANYAFLPLPKPTECPQNWIHVNHMTPTQRACLMKAEEWEAGSPGADVCNEKEDLHVTLYFSQERLNRINIRCTLAI